MSTYKQRLQTWSFITMSFLKHWQLKSDPADAANSPNSLKSEGSEQTTL